MLWGMVRFCSGGQSVAGVSGMRAGLVRERREELYEGSTTGSWF
jgi:hypothetical protein